MQLKGENLSFRYGKEPYIFQNVNIEIGQGERVGLVAKSGKGKSTLAKVLAGYEKPQTGRVLIDDKAIPKSGYNPVQLIYQHPEKAINPRWRMKDVLEESGLINWDLVKAMGIQEDWMSRYPAELSGGELQRFAVCRALREETKFLIADEVSTMLDVITQAQIWNVILEQAKVLNLGMLIVTHNMHLAQKICTRIVELEKL